MINKVSNPHYTNFVEFLNLPQVLVGTQKFNAAEELFEYATCGVPAWIQHDQGVVSAECVHNTDDDESSMPVSVIWKIVFKSGSNYWSETEWDEKTVFFSFDGYNRSHEGRTYEKWREVTPKTKTVEVFE